MNYRNALIGLAAGDAWGYQVEFTSYSRMGGAVAPPTGTWVISDDTQMTLALEDALQPGQSVAEATAAIVREFSAWARSPLNDRAPGNTCMGSIRNLDAGRQWFEPGGAIESAGCGAVMRLLPATTDDDRWVGLTTLQAVITHRHPLAVISALVLADAVRRPEGRFLARGIELIDAISDGGWPGLSEPCLAEVLAPLLIDIPSWIASEAPTLRNHLVAAQGRLARGADGDPCAGVGEGWDAGTATALALMVADAPLSPFAALQWAATSNGDSDSIAAMAGMLIGAGADSPTFWGDAGVSPTFEPEYRPRL
ncbi:ADP-ribosylglycohydrolase family protein [Tsukamurella sp. NPDC003166]|uniref:ADP-ribosylglycohydrolase family protein n=1 Tax=Tsukamurella sp. NPDC003166 TaxID=3154444 RepID=UPI0033AB47C8